MTRALIIGAATAAAATTWVLIIAAGPNPKALLIGALMAGALVCSLFQRMADGIG